MALYLSFLFYFSLAAKLVEYRLGYNYGEVFHDFSGNYRDGVNGLSSTTTTANTIGTDRGAFFPGSANNQITLPSNDQQSSAFLLPSTFTIAVWFLSYSSVGGAVFYRYKSSSDYFAISHASNTAVVSAIIVIGGSSSSSQNGLANSFNTRK